MIEDFCIELLREFGFPAFIVIILLWDKMKSNGNLKRAVENNTKAIVRIQQYLDDRTG